MNTVPDYYKILGADPGASPEELGNAFRKQAKRCHPDHGGSHEAMLLLNEAWEVLKNPISRRDYDDFRARHGVPTTSLSTVVRKARETASDYPRNWSDFEQWMNLAIQRMINDFTNVQYGETEQGYPTAPNSVSGTFFIVAGGVAGTVLMFICAPFILNFPTLWGGEPKAFFPAIVFISVFIGGGCFLGKFLHQLCGRGVGAVAGRRGGFSAANDSSTRTQAASPPPAKIKITCPHCSQSIEATAEIIGTIVACPACKKSFHVGRRSQKSG